MVRTLFAARLNVGLKFESPRYVLLQRVDVVPRLRRSYRDRGKLSAHVRARGRGVRVASSREPREHDDSREHGEVMEDPRSRHPRRLPVFAVKVKCVVAENDQRIGAAPSASSREKIENDLDGLESAAVTWLVAPTKLSGIEDSILGNRSTRAIRSLQAGGLSVHLDDTEVSIRAHSAGNP